MFISKKKHREMVEQEIMRERERMEMEQRQIRLSQELYSEVGRLETMIRHVEARVMAHVEENKHENA